MKIYYSYYEDKEYEEITLKELQENLSKDHETMGIFIIKLEDIKDNNLYFREIDAYDY